MQKLMLRDTQVILPTTAKLFGAVGLAATGYCGAGLIPSHLPAGTEVEGLAAAAASFGLLLGWRVIGAQPGHGFVRAMQRAINAAVYLVLWTMGFLGALQMLRQLARGRYDTPMEAVSDILAKGVELGGMSLQLDVLVTLFCGAMVSATVAEWAWKRWQ